MGWILRVLGLCPRRRCWGVGWVDRFGVAFVASFATKGDALTFARFLGRE